MNRKRISLSIVFLFWGVCLSAEENPFVGVWKEYWVVNHEDIFFEDWSNSSRLIAFKADNTYGSGTEIKTYPGSPQPTTIPRKKKLYMYTTRQIAFSANETNIWEYVVLDKDLIVLRQKQVPDKLKIYVRVKD